MSGRDPIDRNHPVAKGQFCTVHQRVGGKGRLGLAIGAFEHVPRFDQALSHFAAFGANKAARPADTEQEIPARLLVRKQRHKPANGHHPKLPLQTQFRTFVLILLYQTNVPFSIKEAKKRRNFFSIYGIF